MKLFVLLTFGILSYVNAQCAIKSAQQWKDLGCDVQIVSGTNVDALGVVSAYGGFKSCSIACTGEFFTVSYPTGQCDSGYKAQTECELCPSCVPTTCNAGEYMNSGTCAPCAANSFSAAEATECTSCAANSYSAEGTTQAAGCTKCAADYYSVSGAGCTKCAAGSSSVSGSECTECAAGESSVSGSGCTGCDTGKSSAAGGACTATNTLVGRQVIFKDRYNRRGSKTKPVQRTSFRNLFNQLKGTMTNNRMKILKGDLVLSEGFKIRLRDRTEVEVIGSGSKNETALVNCNNADVNLESQVGAYSIQLNDGDTALICNGVTPVTKLANNNEVHTAHCYNGVSWDDATSGSENPWTNTLIAEEDDYACSGLVFTVGSVDGVTCDVNLAAGAIAGDCGATLAEGATCQPVCPTGTTDNGPTTCTLGVISNTECSPIECTVTLDPVYESTDCGATLAYGKECTVVCPLNTTASGHTTCSADGISNTECTPIICDVTLGAYATDGDCGETLAYGASCTPVCTAGSTLNVNTTCFGGNIVNTECVVNSGDCPDEHFNHDGNSTTPCAACSSPDKSVWNSLKCCSSPDNTGCSAISTSYTAQCGDSCSA
jgi:hypothetical protein